MTRLTHNLVWPCYTDPGDYTPSDAELEESMDRPTSSNTASGFSPLKNYEAAAKADPMPRGTDYIDPIVFARDYEDWLNRHGQTMERGEKPKLRSEERRV